MTKNYVAKALLFDQLTQASEFCEKSAHTTILLTHEQLKQSIYKELSDLLNTRVSYSSDAIEAFFDDVDDEHSLAGVEGMMGLPSLKNAFAESGRDADILADQCARAIRLYEPRLRNPTVRVQRFDTNQQRLILEIEGDLVVGSLRENVSFVVQLSEHAPE